MKTAITTATVVLLGASAMLLHAQGIPDTGNSRLWEMRKKVQQRSTERTGSYLDQLNESLNVGDPSRAEAALKSAIAQGTLSQSQIEDARGRIDQLTSRQRATLLAEARAKADAEARAAEEQRMAVASASQAQSASNREAAASGGSAMRSTAPESKSTSELDRFYQTYSGGTVTFVVTRDEGNRWITVKDPGTGKQWALYYDTNVWGNTNKNEGKGGGLTINGERLVGARVSVYFHGNGEPDDIKNLDNGNKCEVRDWKVSGYGW